MRIQKKSMFHFFIFILPFFSCNNSINDRKTIDPKKGIINANNNPATAEFYCWCFASGEIKKVNDHLEKPGRSCETLVRIKPSDLIEPRFLYLTTDENEKLAAIKNVVLSKKSSCDTGVYLVDSRFLILVKNDNSLNDTIVYRSDFEMILNEKYLLKYSFNIMDSIRNIMERSEINCPSSN